MKSRPPSYHSIIETVVPHAPQGTSQCVGGFPAKMHILPGPPVGVEAIRIVLNELPLIANGNLGMTRHHFGGPGLSFLHDTGCPSWSFAISIEEAGWLELWAQDRW